MITRDMRVNIDASINYCSKNVINLEVGEVETHLEILLGAYNLERSICDLYKYEVIDIEF